MIKFSISLAVVCISAFSRADVAPEEASWSNHGFYTVDNERVPDGVANSAKSVFRIEVPLYAIDISSQAGVDSVIELEAAYRSELEGDEYLLNIILSQTAGCHSIKLEPCFIYTSGTGFLSGDQKSVWTALHNLDGILDIVEVSNSANFSNGVSLEEIMKIKAFEIPVRIFDLEGRQIFGEPGDYAQISDLSSWFGGDFPLDSSISFTDHTVLKLSRSLEGINPLTLAAGDDLVVGQEIFLVGGPRKTTDRVSIEVPDAPGGSIRVSSGKILSLEEGFRRLGQSADDVDVDLRNLTELAMVGVAGDCVSGNSGGPYLNRDGEVVGVFRSSYPVHDHAVNLDRVCYAIKTDFITIYSELVEIQ